MSTSLCLIGISLPPSSSSATTTFTEFSFYPPHIQNSLRRISLTWLETILYGAPEVDTSLTQVSSEAVGLPYVQAGVSSLWIRPRLPHQI